MNTTELYNKALQIAIRAHEGQTDKSGRPYIMHPIRVAQRCGNPKAQIVALLHDTIEDTSVTAEYLQSEGFPPEIVEAVLSVTRRSDEPYAQYVERAALNPLAREVKIADLEDNMDIRRLDTIGEREVERLRRYLSAWRYLHAYSPTAE